MKMPQEERQELSDLLNSKARINETESTIHFGGDTSPAAIKRNRERGQHQLVQAEKYRRWATEILKGE